MKNLHHFHWHRSTETFLYTTPASPFWSMNCILDYNEYLMTISKGTLVILIQNSNIEYLYFGCFIDSIRFDSYEKWRKRSSIFLCLARMRCSYTFVHSIKSKWRIISQDLLNDFKYNLWPECVRLYNLMHHDITISSRNFLPTTHTLFCI